MTPPTLTEREYEEVLSLTCGDLTEIIDLIGQTAAVARQIFNRYPEEFKRLTRQDNLLALMLDRADGSQERIVRSLNILQARRSADNVQQKRREC